MSRVSAAALAVACLLMGYSLAGNRVGAAADTVHVRQLPSAVTRGDHIELTFAVGSFENRQHVDCTVADRYDVWVGCAANGEVGFNTPPSERVWYDLTRVVMIQRIGQ